MSNYSRCEEMVAALTTGGPFRRWRALRHASRCPRCAAVRDDLQQIAEALGESVPLTVSLRRLWSSAAGDEIAATTSPATWFWPALPAALAVAVLLGAVGLWRAYRQAEHRPVPPRVTSVDVPPVGAEMPRDVQRLRGDVVALAHELDTLGRRADLLDARRDVEALMARLPEPRANGL